MYCISDLPLKIQKCINLAPLCFLLYILCNQVLNIGGMVGSPIVASVETGHRPKGQDGMNGQMDWDWMGHSFSKVLGHRVSCSMGLMAPSLDMTYTIFSL